MMNSVALGHPDHESCGTGFITRLGKPATHEVIERALLALQRLAHRGASDADGSSGDGAGLMTALPIEFFRGCAGELGLTLPASFAVGMLFLPPDSHLEMRRAIEAICSQSSLQLLGWREVPTNSSTLGPQATESAPSVWQCFLASADSASGPDEDLESLLFLFRKRAEAELGLDAYFCSLSSRTIVYKGLLTPGQLAQFYPDLASPDFASTFAIFHQRFSTNTRPAWRLAQPFRFLAHNGEINTVVGNRRWLQAREPKVRARLQAGEWFRCLEPDASDSARLDNGLEILLRQDHSIQAGLLTLVPPAFESDWRLEPQVRSYLEDAARDYEPWDGPAALVFSDGRVLGAKLDRNGLRPLRYQRTSDGWLIAGSEAGIADFNRREIVERQRLGPGEMLMVELASGQIYRNGELLRSIANQRIRGPRSAVLPLRSATAETARTVAEPRQLAAAIGWTEDQLRLLLEPLAKGKEPIWSMGDDTPPAFMSKFRRTLWDYCKQRFAQVTNPAIDPLRESHVMSLRTRIGPEFITDSPLLSGSQLLFLRSCFAPCRAIDATFPVSEGIRGAHEALERIRREVREQKLIVLSDRGTSQERVALPILLAASAVWRTMVEAGKFNVPLIVETAQVVDTHHIALLISVGATCVCPFLAMQLAEETQATGAANFYSGTNAGLRKVLSRMGISTLASYRNSQLFETVGLDREICEEFFESATSVAQEKSLDEILADYIQNHSAAFNAESAPLKD